MILLIPAAGKGKRLRPQTYVLPKPLIKVAGKPIIAHVIDRVPLEKIEKILLIISPNDNSNGLVEFVSSYVGNKEVKGIIQDKPLGLAHAIYQAKDYIDSDLLIVLSDTIFEGKFNFNSNFIAVKKIENPRRFGVISIGEDGYIKDMVEKPEVPPSNYAIIGVYYIKDSEKLFHSIEEIIEKDIKTKDEYQLTDALRLMLKKGVKIKPFEVSLWLDTGKPEALLEANKILLKKQMTKRVPQRLKDCLIIPPVYMDEKEIELENCIIGPYVSLGKSVKVKSSIISNSIIDDGAVIENCILENSIIGKEATLKREKTHINISAHSQIIYR